jgi:hypothetical protein
VVSSGISTPFGELFQTLGQITHVLRTRAPLYSPLRAFSLDLHVLGTPPAFVLSQDQTLQLRVFSCLPPLTRRAGMCFGMICKLKEMRDRIPSYACYSVFKDRASSLGSSDLLSSRALTAAESRRLPFCVKEDGVTTSAVLRRQEGVSKPSFEPPSLRLEGADFYINPPHPVKPSRRLFPPFRPSSRRASLLRSDRGAASNPSRESRQEKRQDLRTAPPGHFRRRGRVFYRPSPALSSGPRLSLPRGPSRRGTGMKVSRFRGHATIPLGPCSTSPREPDVRSPARAPGQRRRQPSAARSHGR